MAEAAWRVAIIDSGLDPRSGIVPVATRRFVDDGQCVIQCDMIGDSMGHGTAIAEIIFSEVGSELLVAQVMDERGASTPATVAAAIDWAISNDARLIHLSLGLAHDRSILEHAISAAVAADLIVIAAVPARGALTYPAAYPGVVRATGDARCRSGQISALDIHHEASEGLFGACTAFVPRVGRSLRGASIGAAHVTSFIVSQLLPDIARTDLCRQLAAVSSYRGREKRTETAVRA